MPRVFVSQDCEVKLLHLVLLLDVFYSFFFAGTGPGRFFYAVCFSYCCMYFPGAAGLWLSTLGLLMITVARVM